MNRIVRFAVLAAGLVAASAMSSTSAWDERCSEAVSERNITLRSPPPGVMPDHS